MTPREAETPPNEMPAPALPPAGMRGAIALVLRIGVILAAGVGLVGGALYLWRHGGELPHYRIFRGEPNEYRTLAGVLKGVFADDSRAITQLSVMILIVVPVARVALALIDYVRARDVTYVGVTLIVLAVLIHGLVDP